METLNFDKNGYLQPAQIHIVGEEVFKSYFCENEIRSALYEKYMVLIVNLKEIVESSFYVWLNGSFISKKSNPKDIDILTST